MIKSIDSHSSPHEPITPSNQGNPSVEKVVAAVAQPLTALASGAGKVDNSEAKTVTILLNLAEELVKRKEWDRLKGVIEKLEGKNTTDLYALKSLWHLAKGQKQEGKEWFDKFLKSQEETKFANPEKLVIFFHQLDAFDAKFPNLCAIKLLDNCKSLSPLSKSRISYSFATLIFENYQNNLYLQFCLVDQKSTDELKHKLALYKPLLMRSLALFNQAFSLSQDRAIYNMIFLIKLILVEVDEKAVPELVKYNLTLSKDGKNLIYFAQYVLFRMIFGLFNPKANDKSMKEHLKEICFQEGPSIYATEDCTTLIYFPILELISLQKELELSKYDRKETLLAFTSGISKLMPYALPARKNICLKILASTFKEIKQYPQAYASYVELFTHSPSMLYLKEILDCGRFADKGSEALSYAHQYFSKNNTEDDVVEEFVEVILRLMGWEERVEKTFLQIVQRGGMQKSVLLRVLVKGGDEGLLFLEKLHLLAQDVETSFMYGLALFRDSTTEKAAEILMALNLDKANLKIRAEAKIICSFCHFTLGNIFYAGFFYEAAKLLLEQVEGIAIDQEVLNLLEGFDQDLSNLALRLTNENKKELFEIVVNEFINLPKLVQDLSTNEFLNCLVAALKKLKLGLWLNQHPDQIQAIESLLKPDEFVYFKRELRLKIGKKQPVTQPVEVSKADSLEAFFRTKALEDEHRLREKEEKRHYLELRKQAKKEKKAPQIISQSTSIKPIQIPKETSIPEEKGKPISEKKEEIPKSLPKPKATKPLELVPLSELVPYKKEVDEEDFRRSKKVEKKAPVGALAAIDNGDVNRVKAAIQHLTEANNLLSKVGVHYPIHIPRNRYFVMRGWMYHLMRLGESLHPTADNEQLSQLALKEVNSLFNLDIAHNLRNDVRNWFQFITFDRVQRTVQETCTPQCIKNLEGWIVAQDRRSKHLATPLEATQHLHVLLNPLVRRDEKEAWEKLTIAEKREKYLKILLEEFEQLELFPDSDKISLTNFSTYASVEREAVKMSCSIIDKCLDGLQLNIGQRLKIKRMSNVIGHSIGDTEQIRFFKYEEISSAMLYEFARNAKNLKQELLSVLT